MLNLFINIIKGLNSVLPASPIQSMLKNVQLQYVSYINYFIPFDIARDMTLIWLDAMLLYYLYIFVRKLIIKYGLDLIIDKL